MENIITHGKRVLVRAGGAGVHYGTLINQNGPEVRLRDARRIWSWSGALSLSEIAMKGLTISGSKISVPVDEIILPSCLEVISISDKSNLP